MAARGSAQYLRMSTEHQKYSPEFQAAVNAAYAAAEGLQIVRTYADLGVSGLTLSKREGLKALLADVVSGQADFDVVLVYDVSRWGRFQDADQAAHYEFICREAGVQVAYTAEPFTNDGSIASTLVKYLKRAMAAEFSRDLSAKITASKRGLGLQGYWPGGNPGFALRRASHAGDGQAQRTFEPGERNAIKGRRIVVRPGPAAEVALVRHIFDLCISADLTPNAIARTLNAEGAQVGGKPWTQMTVRRVLTNELYVGTRVIGRAEVRLGACARQPEDAWIRVREAAEAIVPQSVFDAAQHRLVRRRRMTDDELLDGLRSLLARKGRLSHSGIARDPTTACPAAYRNRFGSLMAAYLRVGYVPTPEQRRLTDQIAPHRPGGLRPSPSPLSDEEVIARLAKLCAREGRLTLELIEVTPGLPRARNLLRRFGSIENAYRLAGHEPTARQRKSLDRKLRPLPGSRVAS